VSVCEYACTCACVLAHVCRTAGAPGAGSHVCRAPGAVQECRAPGAGAHVCRAAGAGAGAAGAGAGAGGGLHRSSLFSHPPNFIFAKPRKPRSL